MNTREATGLGSLGVNGLHPGCWFPRAAVLKDHNPGGLEQLKFIFSLFWKPDVCPKSKCWQGWFFLEALRESLPQASLLASAACWQPLASLGLETHPLTSASLLMCLCPHIPLFIRTVIGLGPTLLQRDLIFP